MASINTLSRVAAIWTILLANVYACGGGTESPFTPVAAGADCSAYSDCASGSCDKGTCAPGHDLSDGSACASADECASGRCTAGKCGSGSGSGSNKGSGSSTTTTGPQYPGSGSGFRPLIPGCGPDTADDCTGECEASGGDPSATIVRPPATLCFEGPEDPTPDDPIAVIEQVVETIGGKSYVHLRVTFDPTFVDNTYGVNACCGWEKHTFRDLVGSDHLQLLLTNGDAATVMEIKLDYISEAPAAPCGHDALGVSGGEGKVVLGDPAAVIAAATSIDRNLNGCGYCETLDSPATDEAYTANMDTPLWDYRVVYEVWLDLGAFGSSGFGQAYITNVHASPSKLMTNTVEVIPTPCPPEWDEPYCPPDTSQEGGNCFPPGDGECPVNEQLYLSSEGMSLCTPIPFANYPDMAPCPEGYELDVASEGKYCLPAN